MNLLVLHGPNLNLLGEREPDVYGHVTLIQINAELQRRARAAGWGFKALQSNSEGVLVDRLQAERRWATGILFNPGALTHTSYVLAETVAALGIPTIEVHLSDIRAREPWRRVSRIASSCLSQISGEGAESYYAGFEALRSLG